MSKGTLIYRVVFQFTPLREGRRIRVNLNYFQGKFQFTPLREGRLRGCTFSAQR